MLKQIVKILIVCLGAPLALAHAANPAQEQAPMRSDFGKVEAIEIYRGAETQPVNVGSVLGGLAGGVIGHQIGSGRGNTAATIAGAIGGAVVGNAGEEAGAGHAPPNHDPPRLGQHASRGGYPRGQPSRGRPGAGREQSH